MAVVIALVVVIMVIPIAFRVPATFVLIPPSVVTIPAALAGFAEFNSGAVCLPAAVAVVGNRLVKFVVGAGDAALAIVLIGAHEGRCGEYQKGCERDGSQRLCSEQ